MRVCFLRGERFPPEKDLRFAMSLFQVTVSSQLFPRFFLAGAMVFCAGFFFGIARGTPLLGWDFESGVQGWTGVNASVATVASTRESGASALSVTMNANASYDGGEVDIASAIPALTAVFQAQGLVEVSAWVKIPDASEKNCVVAMSLRTTNGKFTYLDRLRTSETSGIQREDGWVRMRCVVPAFRMAWSEYEHDMQSGALYTPTTLKFLIRSQNAGDTFLVDDIQFRKMVPGEFCDYSPPATSSPDDFLRPCGKGYRLLDGKGDDIILNGINLWLYSDTNNDPLASLWNYYLYCFDKADFVRIRQEYGMNVVRLNLDCRWFEKTYDSGTQVSVFSDAGFAWLDQTISWAIESGVYLILDLHSPPGGYQGPGGPVAAYFSDANLKRRTENFWVAVAERYKHEPQIAAFDLINEPRPVSNADWYQEAQRLVSAIRSRSGDDNHLILVEMPFPTDGKGAEVVRLSDPAGRLLYDTHYYSPASFAFDENTSSSYSSANTNLTDGVFGELSFVRSDKFDDTVVSGFLPVPFGLSESVVAGLYSGQLTGNGRVAALKNLVVAGAAPCNVGEYGVYASVFARDPEGAVAYLRDLQEVMDYYHIHRQYFCYHGGPLGLHGSFTGFAPVARLRNEVLHGLFVSLKSDRAAMLKAEDRDGDSVADIWEEANFGGLEATAGTQDFDADGASDFFEYLAGTDAKDGLSRFAIAEAALEGGGFRISWDAVPGRRYTVEQSDTLEAGSFTPVAFRSVNRKIRDSVTIPDGGGYEKRFWRLKVSE